jgi:hypothetical protein
MIEVFGSFNQFDALEVQSKETGLEEEYSSPSLTRARSDRLQRRTLIDFTGEH